MSSFRPVTHFLNTRASTGLRASALAAALLMAGATGTQAAAPQAEVVKGRVLVMTRAGLPAAALDRIVSPHGGKTRRVGNSDLHIVDLPAGASEQAVATLLARHPHLKFAELDQVVRPGLATNDPYLGSQWHLTRIGAVAAWDSTLGAGVTIAILDTGVDGTHPDLAPLLVPGWNVYDNSSNTADVYGHGTKVAGAAAAAANNGTGVAGVAGAARIMPIRISDASGGATFSAMAQGLTWAADHGARVANISYVAAGSQAVISAAQYLKSKGGLVTTSAGNYGTDAGIAPTTSMIPVSATTSGDALASWSSFGAFVAVSAPGEGIYTSTSGGGYGAVSGTSFASPVTAGVLALMMSARPGLSNGSVESLLYGTAQDLGAAGRDPSFGYGRVNAAAAVQAALTAVETVDSTAPSASVTAPLASSTVSGLVAVNVAAADNVGVSRVDLWVNGKLLASDAASPFAFTWDSTSAANGSNSLQVKAYDAAGNAGSSAVVTVNVANAVVVDTTAPVVKLVKPVNGSVVSGTVAVGVSATDNAGAAGLSQTLSLNGTVVAKATGGSLSYSWNTRKSKAGSYTLTATARDAAGNSSSQSVQVSVK